jgi:hypothetical protein
VPPGFRDALSPRRAAVAGLVLLAALPVVGRFASPVLAWGVHLTAYLPPFAWILALAGWLVLFLGPLRRQLDRLVFGHLANGLFGRARWPALALALAALAGFALLTTPTHLLGDGVLVGDMVANGDRFRAADGMDYLLHRLIYAAIFTPGDFEDAFRLMRWAARANAKAGSPGCWACCWRCACCGAPTCRGKPRC